MSSIDEIALKSESMLVNEEDRVIDNLCKFTLKITALTSRLAFISGVIFTIGAYNKIEYVPFEFNDISGPAMCFIGSYAYYTFPKRILKRYL